MSTSRPEPAVSVVIASHGRCALLAETLDALDRQTMAGFEVMVVDDDSPDATPELLAARGVRTIRVSRRGPGRARDVGWRAAAGDIVAFTDDDCVPTPGWLEALVAPIVAGDADFVQGRTLPRPDQAELAGTWSRTQVVEEENGFYQTCNIAYRRTVLEAVDGFDAGFSGPLTAGEDTDLAWRAIESGFRSRFSAEALVHHAVWPSSYREFLLDRRRRAMVVQVVQRHPQTRRLAYRRYFYRQSHARVLALAALLLVAGRLRLWAPPVLIGGGILAHALALAARSEPRAGRTLRLAQVLVADGVEVAAFAAASIRYRTLLL